MDNVFHNGILPHCNFPGGFQLSTMGSTNLCAISMSLERGSNSHATVAYVAPFIAFVGVMAIERSIGLPAEWLYPVRFAIVLALILVFSRPYLNFRPSFPLASIAMGLAVFVIWVAPDILFGYRNTWLFNNSLTGTAVSSMPPELKKNTA